MAFRVQVAHLKEREFATFAKAFQFCWTEINHTEAQLTSKSVFYTKRLVILYGLPPVASFQNKRSLATVFFALHINVSFDGSFVDANG